MRVKHVKLTLMRFSPQKITKIPVSSNFRKDLHGLVSPHTGVEKIINIPESGKVASEEKVGS